MAECVELAIRVKRFLESQGYGVADTGHYRKADADSTDKSFCILAPRPELPQAEGFLQKARQLFGPVPMSRVIGQLDFKGSARVELGLGFSRWQILVYGEDQMEIARAIATELDKAFSKTDENKTIVVLTAEKPEFEYHRE